MKIYLVGGAVRDELLGLPITERDWVVVGSSPEEMAKLGYKPVGKDFPVFLHPKTHEEYALARIERKIGLGYKGFNFDTTSDVSLEEDLRRRDLTINAMAKDGENRIIDPFGGREDLKNKILRHVSSAFVEDPVRILRLARFAARFGDFKIALETLDLIRYMVGHGEVNALVPERVWQECFSALQMDHPQRFFQVLQDCQALDVLFPELIHCRENLQALQRAAERSLPVDIRLASLLYPLDRKSIETICQRYRVPRSLFDFALMVAHYYPSFLQATDLTAEQLLDVLHALDAFRRPERFEQFLLACDVISAQDVPSVQSRRVQGAYGAAKSADPQVFLKAGLQGQAIAKALREAQVNLIRDFLASVS